MIANENGALRESKKSKGRFDLLPYIFLEKLAQHLEHGAVLHSENNWRKGLGIKECYSSALRHLLKATNTNFINDSETEDYHLIACVFNLMSVIEEKNKNKKPND